MPIMYGSAPASRGAPPPRVARACNQNGDLIEAGVAVASAAGMSYVMEGGSLNLERAPIVAISSYLAGPSVEFFSQNGAMVLPQMIARPFANAAIYTALQRFGPASTDKRSISDQFLWTLLGSFVAEAVNMRMMDGRR